MVACLSVLQPHLLIDTLASCLSFPLASLISFRYDALILCHLAHISCHSASEAFFGLIWQHNHEEVGLSLKSTSDSSSTRWLSAYKHKSLFNRWITERWPGPGGRWRLFKWEQGQLVHLNSRGHRGSVHDLLERSWPCRLLNQEDIHTSPSSHTRATARRSKFMG